MSTVIPKLAAVVGEEISSLIYASAKTPAKVSDAFPPPPPKLSKVGDSAVAFA